MHTYNTPAESQPPALPRFVWPKPGSDVPRLPWADWLRLVALQLMTDYPGPVGRFLANVVGAQAIQAEALRASDPEAHETLAHEAALQEQAWVAALEAEIDSPGHWEPDAPDPCDLSDWGGHADADDMARRGWYSQCPEDDTWLN